MHLVQGQRNSKDVGTAGAKGFRPALCGLDVKDVGENEAIERQDGETAHNDVDS